MAAGALAVLGGGWRSESIVCAAGDTAEGKKPPKDPCCPPAKSDAADAVSRATQFPATAKSGEPAAAIACSLTDNAARQRLDDVRRLLSKAATGVDRGPRAVKITFADGHSAEIVSFIELERACCPFLSFTLEFPSGKPMALRVSAPNGGEAVLGALFPADSGQGRP
jgi:hypothetical protein